MDLFEYQGKRLFAEYGIRIPQSILVESAAEIPVLAMNMVVKPQVKIGGRGKAGAIHICGTHAEIAAAVENSLVTPIKGHLPAKILLEEKVAIKQEYYLSIYVDRQQRMPVILFSPKGGVEVESLGKDEIAQVSVSPIIGLQPFMLNKLLTPFCLSNDLDLRKLVTDAYRLFSEKMLLLLEINPLVTTEAGSLMALDAKIVMDEWVVDTSISWEPDDSALQTPFEKMMSEYNMSAVEMEGDIVVFGWGAGSTMATADSIRKKGGSLRAMIDINMLHADNIEPEGKAFAVAAMKHILDLKPKALLMNIFYQAGRLDYTAQVVKEAFAIAAETMPIAARCKGRMAAEGLEILRSTPILVTDSYEAACDFVLHKTGRGE